MLEIFGSGVSVPPHTGPYVQTLEEGKGKSQGNPNRGGHSFLGGQSRAIARCFWANSVFLAGNCMTIVAFLFAVRTGAAIDKQPASCHLNRDKY